MTTWLEDANGNKCSVDYFGYGRSEQEAIADLQQQIEDRAS